MFHSHKRKNRIIFVEIYKSEKMAIVNMCVKIVAFLELNRSNNELLELEPLLPLSVFEINFI